MKKIVLALLTLVAISGLQAAKLDIQTVKGKSFDKLHNETLTSQEKMSLLLMIAEDYVGYVETNNIYLESDAYETGGGYFQAGGHGVAWGRGGGNVALVYAVMLSEQPSRQTFTKFDISREQLLSHLRNHLRAHYIANINCSRFPGAGAVPYTWGGPSWQASLDIISAAWAAFLMEDELDSDTIALADEILMKEADNLCPPAKTFPNTVDMGDSKSEDCCWNAPVLAFAANKFAEDSRASNWDYYGKKWAMLAVRTEADITESKLVDGVAVSEWMNIVSTYPNLYPDLSLRNHGFWSVGYQIQMMMLADGELAYMVFDNPVPEAYSYHADQMWETIGSVIALSDGDYIYSTGQDWYWKTFTQVQYFARQALCRGDARAAALESRALQSVYKRQQGNGLGDMEYTFATSTAGLKRHMFTYLLHKYSPNSKKRQFTQMDEVDALVAGVHEFPYVQVAIHHNSLKAVSVAWQEGHYPIYVIPNKEDTFVDPPVQMTYNVMNGMPAVNVSCGGATQSHSIQPANITDDNGKMIARYQKKWGNAVTQHITVVSLNDEATVYITHFKADADSTVSISPLFPVVMDFSPGFADKTFNQYRGEKWLNVNDCMGFVSPDLLPANIAAKSFALSDAKNYTVSAGQWFSPAAVVVYVYQNRTETEALKDTAILNSGANGQLTLDYTSSSGTGQVSLFE